MQSLVLLNMIKLLSFLYMALTLILLISYIYIYMELLVKLEIVTSYIRGLTFDNAESSSFLFAAQCFYIDSMQKYFVCHSCV
jgi:hypothetical protein